MSIHVGELHSLLTSSTQSLCHNPSTLPLFYQPHIPSLFSVPCTLPHFFYLSSILFIEKIRLVYILGLGLSLTTGLVPSIRLDSTILEY